MRNKKHVFSFLIGLIFIALTLLASFPAGAIVNTKSIKQDIIIATKSVSQVENVTKSNKFNVRNAENLLNLAMKSVNKIKVYGKTYSITYYKLNNRISAVKLIIDKRIIMDKLVAQKAIADKAAADKAAADKAVADKVAADKAAADKAAADKAAADKAAADKAAADKVAADKAAADKAAADKAAADKAAADKAAADKAAADKAAADKAAADKAAADKAAADKVESDTMVATTSPSAVDDVNKNDLHAFYSGNTKYNSDTESYLKKLTSVSFIWSKLQYSNGSVVLNDKYSGDDFYKPKDYSKPLTLCKANNIPAQIAIYSEGNIAKSIISNADLRKDLINKIISNLKISLDNGDTFDFNGVVIDFEGFMKDDTKEYFNEFLRELKPCLEQMNKKLYVAVDVRAYYPGYDYKEILKYSDKVILMAHGYQPVGDLTKQEIERYINYNSNNPIFTLAPINMVRLALEDLISCINDKTELKKIWLQISFGISQWQFPINKIDDWVTLDSFAVGKRANPTYDLLIARLKNTDNQGTNFSYGYINQLESPYLIYFNNYSKTFNFILYEDSRSVKAKIDLAKSEEIGGISLWRLGTIPDFNDPIGNENYLNIWNVIQDNIK